MGELILVAVVVGAILYVHKVGLPKVLLELQQTRIEMVAAINRHSQATKPFTPPRPNPIPLPVSSKGPDTETGNTNLPQ